MTVLVVDDDKFMRRIIEMMIRTFNPYCTILQADNADQAFEILRKTVVHLLILDLTMPRIHGTQVLTIIRQSKSLSNLSVVVISGETDPAIITTVLKLGVADYIVKPLDPKETPKRLSVIMSDTAAQAGLLKPPDTIENILLIGRDRMFRQMFQEYLTGNFTVTVVESEYHARQKFIDTKPDAIFFLSHDTDRNAEYGWQTVLRDIAQTTHICFPKCYLYSPAHAPLSAPDYSILQTTHLAKTDLANEFVRDIIVKVVQEESFYNVCIVDFLRRQLIRQLLGGVRQMLRDAGDSILGYQAYQATPSGYQIAVEGVLRDTSKQFSLHFGIFAGRDELLDLGSLLLGKKTTMLQASCEALILVLQRLSRSMTDYFQSFDVETVQTSLAARLSIEAVEKANYVWYSAFPFTHQLTKSSFTAFIGVEHHVHHSTMRDTVMADDDDELANEFFGQPEPTPES